MKNGPNPIVVALYVETLFVLGMIWYALQPLFAAHGGGFNTTVHKLVAVGVIGVSFLLGNKFAITMLAREVANGSATAILTALLWFGVLSFPLLTNLTFLGFAYPSVIRLEESGHGKAWKETVEAVNRQSLDLAGAGDLLTSCADDLKRRENCEKESGCVSGCPSPKGVKTQPVADFLGTASARCHEVRKQMIASAEKREAVGKALKDELIAYDRILLDPALAPAERRTKLMKIDNSLRDLAEQARASMPLAALSGLSQELANLAGGIASGSLSEGMEQASEIIKGHGRRLEKFLRNRDATALPLPSFPGDAPLTSAYTHFDQVWVHFLAAFGAESFPLLLFVLAVLAHIRTQEEAAPDRKTTAAERVARILGPEPYPIASKSRARSRNGQANGKATD